MPVSGIDHFSFPTLDSERFMQFYKRLGLRILYEDEWRKGKSRIFAIQIGPNQRINIHPAGYKPSHTGDTTSAGCGDFCFVWDGTMDDVLSMLKRLDLKPALGPAPRTGGRGAGTVPSQSVYIRDPDGNLVEFMVYERRA